MTNREYLHNKKEAFDKKIADILEKYFSIFCGIMYILDLVAIICVAKIDVVFMALVIPFTFLDIGLTICLIEEWLDKEHKEGK